MVQENFDYNERIFGIRKMPNNNNTNEEQHNQNFPGNFPTNDNGFKLPYENYEFTSTRGNAFDNPMHKTWYDYLDHYANQVADWYTTGSDQIVILDDFTNRQVDFDNHEGEDDDFAHGEIVRSFIDPRYRSSVKQVDISIENTGNLSIQDVIDLHDNVLAGLQNIRRTRTAGNQVGAVSMSLSSPISYRTLTSLTGKTINPSNVKQNISLIRQRINETPNEDDREVYSRAVRIADEIGRITREGIPVTLSAGNDPDYFNLFALAEDAIIVTASDEKGKQASWASNNSLVDIAFEGEFTPGVLKSQNKNYLEVTEDNTPDFPYNRLSSVQANPQINPNDIDFDDVSGTSVSAPQAASAALFMSKLGLDAKGVNWVFQSANQMAKNMGNLLFAKPLSYLLGFSQAYRR